MTLSSLSCPSCFHKGSRKRRSMLVISILFLQSIHCSFSFVVVGPSRPTRNRIILQSSSNTDLDQTINTIEKEDIEESASAITNENNGKQEEELTAFEVLAGNIALLLIQSDVKRLNGLDGAATGWTSWVDEKSAVRLQNCIDKMILSLPENPNDPTQIELLEERDDALRWTRWMKASPTPMIIELSRDLQQAVNSSLPGDDELERIETTREECLSRIGCRVIVMPSGSPLNIPIRTAAGSMAYGKLLYGGVTRYRLIGNVGKAAFTKQRKAGERTVVYEPSEKSWLQYGGPDRYYEAVDMGPCALVEVMLLPKGFTLPLLSDESSADAMWLSQMRWDPNRMLKFYEPEKEKTQIVESIISNDEEDDDVSDVDLSGKDHIDMLESSFTSSVGGLQSEIEAIVRRVLDGRLVQPTNKESDALISDDDDDVTSTTSKKLGANEKQRIAEAETLAALGLNPVRGLLLYGPPGCGKTALAREISRNLDARPPKIVAAPELLDRWVGGSEKLVRDLFSEAEAELRLCRGDATKSALHVIVIDEIDAVFRKRTSSEDSAASTRASAVNQILAKLDGVNALGNVLFIGMTNRRELLDEALLRPGRLEVQVKIPLPDKEGRREILQIHFDALRRKGRLSQPLCEAIDGLRNQDDDVRKSSFLRRTKERLSPSFGRRNIRDLATTQWTGGFSGADIAGLVRCAGSLALARARVQGGGIDNLLITLEDVAEALKEVKR